jgi:SAM-dependent methyltransferase
MILHACTDGSVLEIGGGIGNLKEMSPNIISIDIQPAPWLDAVADAQSLPFPDKSFNNIIMVDVLHHIESPVKFFKEASRVLKQNGRLIMLEPAITPVSNIFYRLFHEEPVDMKQNPYLEKPTEAGRKPFDANQAIPTLIFIKSPKTFTEKFPKFKLSDIHYFSLFSYPMSGGFKSWNLLPQFAVKSILRLEAKLMPVLGKYMSFRMLVIIEKIQA